MDVHAEPHPNEIAQLLTGRPYLSYSAVRTYAACPLRWYFRYVLGLPEETVSTSLVFGAALHRALERHFLAQMYGRPAPTIEELMEAYREAWDELPVEPQWSARHDPGALHRLARQMLDTFRASDLAHPRGRIVGVEQELSAELIPGVPQLLARLDLVVDEGDSLSVTDYKTARARWSLGQTSLNADQLLLYHELARPLAAGRPVRLQFVVLTKTRVPQVSSHVIWAERPRIERVKRIVARVWDAMQSGVVYPNPSLQQCATCPFRRACDAWSG
jgi:putative RecB family exonuclease